MNLKILSLILISALSMPFCGLSAEKEAVDDSKSSAGNDFLMTGNIRYHLNEMTLQAKRLRTFKTPTGSEIQSMEKLEGEQKIDKLGTRSIYVDVLIKITENSQLIRGTAYGVVVRDTDSIGETQTQVYNIIGVDELEKIAAGQDVSASPSAENLFDVIEETQKTIISKYPDEISIARKLAIEELEKIARSNKTEEDRIAAIRAKFPSTPTSPDKTEQGTKEKTGN